jgi:hypothetical protein
MPAYNFQKQFAPAVKRGEKHQTIRAKRKNRPRVGQMAYLYTGMRTKKCRLLKKARIKAVYDVRIDHNSVRIFGKGSWMTSDYQLDTFAWHDGFYRWEEMIAWFNATHGLPFHGDLIIWES